MAPKFSILTVFMLCFAFEANAGVFVVDRDISEVSIYPTDTGFEAFSDHSSDENLIPVEGTWSLFLSDTVCGYDTNALFSSDCKINAIVSNREEIRRTSVDVSLRSDRLFKPV